MNAEISRESAEKCVKLRMLDLYAMLDKRATFDRIEARSLLLQFVCHISALNTETANVV